MNHKHSAFLLYILCLFCSAHIHAEQKEVTYPRIRQIMKKAFTEVTPLGERYRCPGSGFGEYFKAQGPQDEQIEKYGVGNKMEGKLADGSEFMILAAHNISLLKRAEEDIDKRVFIEYPPNAYLIIARKPPGKSWNVTVHNEHTEIEKRGMIRRISRKAVLGENQEEIVCQYYSYIQDAEKTGLFIYLKIYTLMTGKRIFSTLGGYLYNFDKDTGQQWHIDFKKQEGAADIITRQEKGSKEIEYYTYNGEKYILDRIGTEEKKEPQLLGSEREHYAEMLKNPEFEKPEKDFKPGEVPEIEKYERRNITDEELMLAVKAAYPEADSMQKRGDKLYSITKDGREKTIYLQNVDKILLKTGRMIIMGLVFSEKIVPQQEKRIALEYRAKGNFVKGYYVIVSKDQDGDIQYYRNSLGSASVYFDWGTAMFPIIEDTNISIFQKVLVSCFKVPSKLSKRGLDEDYYINIYDVINKRLVFRVLQAKLGIAKEKRNNKLLFAGPNQIKWESIDNDKQTDLVLYNKDGKYSLPVYVYKFQNGVFKYWKHGDISIEKESGEKKNKKGYHPIAYTPQIKTKVHVVDESGSGIPGINVESELVRWNYNILRKGRSKKVSIRDSKATNEKGFVSIHGRCTQVFIKINNKKHESISKSYDLRLEPLPEVIEVKLKKKEK